MTRLPDTPKHDESEAQRERTKDWAQQWKELEQRLVAEARTREPKEIDAKDPANASREWEAISIAHEPWAKEPVPARHVEPLQELRPHVRAARAGRRLWRSSQAAVPVLIAFTLGLGAGAVFLRSEALRSDASARGTAQRGSPAVQPGADQALVLKLDGDAAAFGRRADALAPTQREQSKVRR